MLSSSQKNTYKKDCNFTKPIKINNIIKEKKPEIIIIENNKKINIHETENDYDLFKPGISPPQNDFMNKLNMRLLTYNNLN